MISSLGRLAPDETSLTARQRSFAFFTLLVALVLEIVDLTIVNTALPSIERNLGAAGTQSQWIVAGYSLSFATLLILGGRLGDIFGGRTMFLLGVAGFTTASGLCGLAHSTEQLVAARFLQGATGAIMGPQVMTMIQILYDPVERIGRMAWFGVIGGLSAIAGPILGGLLIALNPLGLSWRAVFLINIPIGIAALVAGTLLLPRTARYAERRIDWIGTASFGAALAAFLIPLMEGGDRNWSAGSLGWFVVAAMLAVLGWRGLKVRALRGRPAIIHPQLFRNDTFRISILISLAFSAANTGFLFIFAYGLQRGLGYSALGTGLMHMPFSIGVMFGMAFLGRRYLAHYGKWVLFIGSLVMASGCGATLLWMASGKLSFIVVAPFLVVAGAGMGMVSGPLGSVAVSRVERQQAGSASGMLKTVQQMGGALGVAIGGSAYFIFEGAYRGAGELGALVLVEIAMGVVATLALRLPNDIFARAPTESPRSE